MFFRCRQFCLSIKQLRYTASASDAHLLQCLGRLSLPTSRGTVKRATLRNNKKWQWVNFALIYTNVTADSKVEFAAQRTSRPPPDDDQLSLRRPECTLACGFAIDDSTIISSWYYYYHYNYYITF